MFEPKLHKPGVKIPKQFFKSQIGVNMGFKKFHSTKFGFALNLVARTISLKYHIVFCDIFSTVVSSTSADAEVFINMVTSSSSRIQVILDQ